MTAPPIMLRTASSERKLYFALTLAILIAALAGFARTYYLHGFFGLEAPRPLIWVHGAVMTGWVLLLVVQSTTVRLRRIRWHRRLGWASIGYASLMIVLGISATSSAAHIALVQRSPFLSSQLDVLALELT